MAIVDFQQDPSAPYGTGNFRDDSGRQMYLHDPETASQFVKTMPGASPKKQVADESTAIATGRVALPGGPDQRLARNDSGAAASEGIADINAATGDLAAAVNNPHPAAAPPAPPVPPAAPAVAAPAVPGAPGVPAAAAPTGAPTEASAAPAPVPPAGTGAGAALVDTLGGVQSELSQSNMAARTQPRPPIAGPGSFDTEGLPLGQTEEGGQVSVKEGRPIANAVEEINDRESIVNAGNDRIRDIHRQRGRQLEQGFEAQRTAARNAYGHDVNEVFEKSAATRDAEAKVDALREELKRNDKSLDPDRYMREMSTGKYIGMIILAALNGGFGAINHQTSNGVIDALDHHIDTDIARQREEIASRRVSINNDMATYQRKGFSDAEAEKLARDRLINNLAAFKDAEAKRVGAMPEMMAQADLLIQPRLEQMAKDRAESLRSAEAEVSRSQHAGRTHGTIPGTVITPQDNLATETLEDRRIQRENAAAVGDVVGHPVSIDEAKEIRNDSQDLGKRLATASSARKVLDQLRTELGMVKRNGKWGGDPDPGSRPAGYSGTDRSTLIDTYYANLKRADIMGMVREPSAVLQNEFAQITARPFFDSQIGQQLDAYERVVGMAEQEARRGFSDEATAYYDRKRTAVPTGGGGRRAAAPAPAGKAAPSAAAPPAAAPPPPPAAAPARPKAPGNLRAEQ